MIRILGGNLGGEADEKRQKEGSDQASNLSVHTWKAAIAEQTVISKRPFRLRISIYNEVCPGEAHS